MDSLSTKPKRSRIGPKLLAILEGINERNRLSVCDRQVREGWNLIAREILLASKAYGGFRYLTAHEVPVGCAPGIIRNPDGYPHEYPDESRVSFFLPKAGAA